MNNEQIKTQLVKAIAKRDAAIAAMDVFKPDGEQMPIIKAYEKAEADIERLRITLAVREYANKIKESDRYEKHSALAKAKAKPNSLFNMINI